MPSGVLGGSGGAKKDAEQYAAIAAGLQNRVGQLQLTPLPPGLLEIRDGDTAAVFFAVALEKVQDKKRKPVHFKHHGTMITQFVLKENTDYKLKLGFVSPLEDTTLPIIGAVLPMRLSNLRLESYLAEEIDLGEEEQISQAIARSRPEDGYDLGAPEATLTKKGAESLTLEFDLSPKAMGSTLLSQITPSSTRVCAELEGQLAVVGGGRVALRKTLYFKVYKKGSWLLSNASPCILTPATVPPHLGPAIEPLVHAIWDNGRLV
jgi:hypothetical protein